MRRGTILRRLLPLLALLASRAEATEPAALEVRYELEVEVDSELQTLRGAGRIVLRNVSEAPVDRFLLATYPEVYRQPDPAMTLNQRDLRYARGWSPGSMELVIQARVGGAQPVDQAFQEVRLADPLRPGEEAAIEISFTTHVPEKRGPFGRLDGILTLQGGWHPQVHQSRTGSAIPARYRVRWILPSGVIGPNSGDLFSEKEALPLYSMSLSRRFRTPRVGRHAHQVFVTRPRDAQLRRLGNALDEALDLYRDALQRPEARPVTAALGYLDQRLAAPGAGYLLVSDQVFRAMALLDVFHVRALLDATFETLLLRDYPELRAEPWTAQFLAYCLRQTYFARKHGLGRSLKDLIRGPLRLLPAFDELIHGADFPGRQFYLHRIELGSERQEDLLGWNVPFRGGALVAERLGRIVGEQAVAQLGVDYLRLTPPREPLPRFVEERSARDLGWFFEQWLGPIRPMGFRIAGIRRERFGQGWRTEVQIQREGTRIDLMDVEAALRGRPPHRGSILLDGPQATYAFASPVKPGRIELDPRSQVEESWRADNVSPPRLKLLLYNSRVNLEPKSGELDALALLAFLRQYDYKNLAFLELFTKPLRIGGSIDYAHQFGPPIDPLRYPHTLRMGVGFERTRADETTGEEAASILTLRLGAQHRTANYLGEVDQKNDVLLDLLLEGAPGWPGGTSFFVSRATAARYQRLNSALTLAGRLLVGLSFGDLPRNRRFDLGNANALRGFVASEVLADNVGLLSLELRTDVLRNLDFAFPWGLAVVHRLQLVAFADGARTGSSRDLLRQGSTALDAGVGIRLHGRWFGIMPSMGKIDLGLPLRGGDDGAGVRIYLGLTQAF